VNFSKNLRFLRKKRGLNQQDLAEALGKVVTSISGYETGRFFPPIEVIIEMANFFNVSVEAMVLDDFEDPTYQIEEPGIVRIYPPLGQKSNVFVPVKAQAGYAEEWSQEYVNQYIKFVEIPGVSGEARTFEVSGNSMEPVLLAGDYVSGNRVQDLRDIREGSVHVIVTVSNGIHIKYVRLYGNRALCIPANKIEYDEYYIAYEEIKEIWSADVRVTKSFFDPRELERTEPMNADAARLLKLEAFIRAKFPDYNP
jgi:transcriptional regulator with XRE-family HTH domain